MSRPAGNSAHLERRRSTRRIALLALAALLLAAAGWMYFNSVAGLSGMPTSKMDWNADGTVTRQEMLAAYHAVGVEETVDGRRECSAYYWRRDRSSIRVDCSTRFDPVPDAQ